MTLLTLRSHRASITGAYYVLVVIMGLASASLGPTLPGLAEQVGATLAGMSFIFPMRSLGRMVGTFGGLLFDRYPGHPILAAAAGVIALAMLLTSIAPVLGVLIAISFLMGMAQGLVDVGANALLVWVHGERVSPYMNGLHFSFGVGALFTPLLIAPLLEQPGGVALSYQLLALLMLPAPLLVLALPSPQSPAAHARTEGDRVDLRMVGLIAAFMLLHVGVEVAAGGWIFTYATTFEGVDEGRAAVINSLFWLTFTVGRLMGVPLSARFRPRYILMVDLAGMGLSLLAMLLIPGELGLIIGAMGLGAFIATVFPSMMAFAGRAMPLTGRATSFLFLGGVTGSIIAPWIVGQLFVPVGPVVLPLAMLVSVVLAGGVFALLLRHVNRRALARL